MRLGCVDSSLFCQKLTLHGKILAGNNAKKNQNFSEILEKVEGEGYLFPWRTIYIMYYSMYRRVVKLAHGIRNGAASVDGVDAKLWQVVPETLQEDSAPAKSDAPLITSNDLFEADGFLVVKPGPVGGLWRTQQLAGKSAKIFYSTGSQGGGLETI
ncbi:hypothetical protein HID58_061585, partial [Brassica napus]